MGLLSTPEENVAADNLAKLYVDDEESDGSVVDEDETEYGATVEVTVENTKFVIPVGDGNQDLKWLSLVAANRYFSFVKAKGKQRQREGKRALKEGYYKPVELRVENLAVVRPETKVRDILTTDSNGNHGKAVLEVDLGREIEVDESGEPVTTPWQEAFACSEAGKRRFREQMKSLNFVESNPNDQPEEEFFIPLPTFGEFGLPEQIAAEFEMDWLKVDSEIDLYGIFSAVPSQEEKSKDNMVERRVDALKDVCLAGFCDICALFDHFAWFGRGGGKSLERFLWMSYSELRHCLHISGILDLSEQSTNEKLLISSIVKANRSLLGVADEVEGKNDGLAVSSVQALKFQRHGFIAVLICLLLQKHDPVHLNFELKELIDGKIAPNAVSIRHANGNPVRQALRETELLEKFLDNYDMLRVVFEHYCIGSTNNDKVMTSQEFLLLYRDAKFDEEDFASSIENPGDIAVGEEKVTSEPEEKTLENIVETLDRCKENVSLIQDFGFKRHVQMKEIVFTEFLELLLLTIRQKITDPDVSIEDAASFAFKNMKKHLARGNTAFDEDEAKK